MRSLAHVVSQLDAHAAAAHVSKATGHGRLAAMEATALQVSFALAGALRIPVAAVLTLVPVLDAILNGEVAVAGVVLEIVFLIGELCECRPVGPVVLPDRRDVSLSVKGAESARRVSLYRPW